jgi:hypothetical protein
MKKNLIIREDTRNIIIKFTDNKSQHLADIYVCTVYYISDGEISVDLYRTDMH